MWSCRPYLYRVTQITRNIIAQGSSSSDFVHLKNFYSSLTYEDEFEAVEVPDLAAQLLPFQKEGVGWMASREVNHVGGIMADHLGMGKTVQMIGLCLVSENMNKLFFSNKNKERRITANTYRVLTVARQLQKMSVTANCSRLNRPAENLNIIVSTIEKMIESGSNLDALQVARNEIDKWLLFAAKFHPVYAQRANAFLDDELKRDFDNIESKELRTLVVVPAALMFQWKYEIESKINFARKTTVYLYHGYNKWISSTELQTFDFVITTYDTLTCSAHSAFILGDDGRSFAFNRKEAGPLFHVNWKRVILDEAHMIRHAKTVRWRAVQEVYGVHRWAVTATPLHNSIHDMQNLLHFVGLPRLPILPGSNQDELLNDPILQRSIARSLQPAFLRRGPVMIRNGIREVLVELPEKKEVVVKHPFTIQESQLYNNILTRSRSALDASERKDAAFHIFAMMTRLRQACCHPWISQGIALQISICEICNSEASGAVSTKCGHMFCYECLMLKFSEAIKESSDHIATRVPCPSCGNAVSYNSVFRKASRSSAERIATYKLNEFELSTKLRMILKAIHEMFTNFPDDKMIIFSHFTSFMDVIAVALERYGIESYRIDGTMTLPNRNAIIRAFQTNASIKVVLASKTATGVGLNLTAANHVLVVDPWWNPAIEEQAVHRCYRIGQKKIVYVTRFIISDTIEQYCYDICQRKKEFGDAILRAATSGDSGAKVAASKLHEIISRLKYVDEQDCVAEEAANCEKKNTPPEKIKQAYHNAALERNKVTKI